MKTHRLVMPEDLNQYGSIFGGELLSWVDEACWIAASLDYPEHRFVTIGMDKVEFHHGVSEGVILEIDCEKQREGNTSVTYKVQVKRANGKGVRCIFSTCVTFVNIDTDGKKQPIR